MEEYKVGYFALTSIDIKKGFVKYPVVRGYGHKAIHKTLTGLRAYIKSTYKEKDGWFYVKVDMRDFTVDIDSSDAEAWSVKLPFQFSLKDKVVNPLFLTEAVNLDVTTQLVLERLASMNLNKSNYSPAKALYMFGSRSRGSNRIDSDVDLVLELEDLPLEASRNDPASSIFNYSKRKQLEKEILRALGTNPQTGRPFEIDLVGSYELRFFPNIKVNTKYKITPFN